MRAVATGALHLVFPKGHVGIAHPLGPFLLVALSAGFNLTGLGKLETFGGIFHHFVTAGAGNLFGIVRASIPKKPVISTVALQADGVLLFRRRGSPFAKGDQITDSPTPARFGMGPAGAVACFTSKGFFSGFCF